MAIGENSRIVRLENGLGYGVGVRERIVLAKGRPKREIQDGAVACDHLMYLMDKCVHLIIVFV